jgi:hypothetical protein
VWVREIGFAIESLYREPGPRFEEATAGCARLLAAAAPSAICTALQKFWPTWQQQQALQSLQQQQQ